MREGWRRVRLLDVVALPSGQVDPRETPYSSWPLLAPNHVESGTGRWFQVETAAQQRAISGKYMFAAGDVIYSKIRPYLRKAVLADRPGLCSADMYPLRPSPELDARFLLDVLLSPNFTEFTASVSARTGIPKVNREELGGFFFDLPPLSEQRRIAALLSAMDRLAECSGAVRDAVRVVSDVALGELIRHEGDERPLAECLERIEAGWSPQCEARPAAPHEWGVLKVSAVSAGEYREAESKALPAHLTPRPATEVRAGDLLLARASGVLDLVGRTVLVRRTRPRLMLSDKLLRLVPKASIARADYLHFAMRTTAFRHRLLGGTGGSHMRNVSQETLRAVPLPVPSLERQRAIAASLLAIEERLEAEDGFAARLSVFKAATASALLGAT